MIDFAKFAPTLIAWQREYGRHDLPWQNTRDPYRIWLSEVMLQQTQVASVIEYYKRFIAQFPDIKTLAQASVDDVLSLWSGLGYYSRARNLHLAARHVMTLHGGRFPCEPAVIESLPGIGRSTAAAIAAFAYDTRAPILDGNVKRVFARLLGIRGYPGERKVEVEFWRHAGQLLPGNSQDMPVYTQALMDFGATLCTRSKPACTRCPFQSECIAWNTGRVAELPEPRPRKALPSREIRVLILLDAQDRIYFEKRSPTGIWGGMLSLPELDLDADVIDACRERFSVEVEPLSALDPFVHTFTHFRLTLHPQPLRVGGINSRCAQNGGSWLKSEEAITKALPAPIRRVLNGAPY